MSYEPKLEIPRYVDEGDEVAIVNIEGRIVRRGVVVVACGHSCRVSFGSADSWYRLDELRIEIFSN